MKRILAAIALFAALTPFARAEYESAPAKPPEGFTSLFNGKDLDGWQALGGKLTSWHVEKGLLYVKGGGGWIMTKKEYGDFELRVEFRLTKGSNSGVALRAPLKGDPAYEGMEIQILDDPAYKGLQKWQATGSIYDVKPAAKVPTKPIGEWNAYTITCKGRKVTIVLNGETVVDANLDDHVKEKGKKHPGILREKGYIGFQEHGGRVEFKNIFVKEL